jgi:hypothetical protein
LEQLVLQCVIDPSPGYFFSHEPSTRHFRRQLWLGLDGFKRREHGARKLKPEEEGRLQSEHSSLLESKKVTGSQVRLSLFL